MDLDELLEQDEYLDTITRCEEYLNDVSDDVDESYEDEIADYRPHSIGIDESMFRRNLISPEDTYDFSKTLFSKK